MLLKNYTAAQKTSHKLLRFYFKTISFEKLFQYCNEEQELE